MPKHIMKVINDSVKKSIKPFNNNLLQKYRKDQIENSVDFVATVYSEAIKLFKGIVKFDGYMIVSPEERLEYEYSGNIKTPVYNIKKSELSLVKYNFEFLYEEQPPKEFSIYIYLPYLMNDFIVLNDSMYSIQFSLTDRVFSKNGDKIVVKLLRSPVVFFTKLENIISLNTKELFQVALPFVKIHNESIRAKNFTTIFHYFICKYGLNTALQIFGLSPEDVYITEDTNLFDDAYLYFAIEKKKKSPSCVVVRKDIFIKTAQVRDITCSLVKILSNVRTPNIKDLYKDENIAWKVLLGKVIKGPKTARGEALNTTNKHLESLETYLDPISRRRFDSFGLTNLESIYDLFKVMMDNLHEYNIRYVKTDYLLKRIDCFDQVLIDVIVKPLYNNIYRYQKQNTQSTLTEVIKALKLYPESIRGIYKSQNISSSINMYNNLKLFNYLTKIIIPTAQTAGRQTDNIKTIQHMKVDISHVLVFSQFGSSTNQPMSTATINPYTEINEFGGFEISDFYKKLSAKNYNKYFK